MVPSKSLIDCHAHFTPIGLGEGRGWMSPRMRKGWVFRLASRALGVARGDFEALARAYIARLRRQVEESRTVRAVVILALDGVYDSSGRLDLDATSLWVPNDVVLEAAAGCPAFLAGASINPARRDALDELERVAAARPALLKWLPNAQGFDPGDPAHRPFLRRVADLGLPLLVHCGQEFAVPSAWQQMGHPDRWQGALDLGVKLIAAHGGSQGTTFGDTHNPAFLRLVERYPNLYADTAALAGPPRGLVMKRLVAHGEAASRLTFGTDYPIPNVPAFLLSRLQARAWREAAAERNYFDRYVRILEGLGWQPSSRVFEGLLGPAQPAG